MNQSLFNIYSQPMSHVRMKCLRLKRFYPKNEHVVIVHYSGARTVVDQLADCSAAK